MTTTRPLFAGPGFIDREIAALQVGPIERLNGRLGLFTGPHRDEGEAAGAPAHPIDHQVDFGDGAELGEGILQIIFRDVVGEITDKQFRVHVGS